MWKPVALITATGFSVQLANIVSSVVVARALGPVGRGELSAILAWATVATPLLLLGVDVAIARRASRHPQHHEGLFIAAIALSLLLGVQAALLGTVLVVGFFPLQYLEIRSLVFGVLWVAPASIASVLLANLALGRKDYRGFNSIRASFYVAYLVLVIGAVASGMHSVLAFAAAFVLAAYIGAAYGALRGIPSGFGRQIWPRVRQLSANLVRSGLPFWPVILLQGVATNLPTLLLTFLVGSDTIGFFVIAMVAANAHVVLAQAIGRVMFAEISGQNLGHVGPAVLTRFRQAVCIFGLLSFAAAAIVPQLIPWVFGTQFGRSETACLTAIPAAGLLGLCAILEDVLKGSGNARYPALALLANCGAILAVGIALGSGITERGMVLAITAGIAIQFTTLLLGVARRFHLSPAALLVPQWPPKLKWRP